MQLFNVLGFSAVFLALAGIIGFLAPRRSATSWLWMVVAGALVFGAIALPIGLRQLP